MTDHKPDFAKALEYNNADIIDAEYMISLGVKVSEAQETLEVFKTIRLALKIADAVMGGPTEEMELSAHRYGGNWAEANLVIAHYILLRDEMLRGIEGAP